MSTLERAIVIAAEGHAGVKDKGGAPYVLHPLRMMLSMSARLKAEGFAAHIITALDSVTKREGEEYEDFARRAAADPIGRPVKLADLEDNSDISRIAEPTEVDYRRIGKYQNAIKLIQAI